MNFELAHDSITTPALNTTEAGGFVDFVGRVRRSSNGREVVALEYDAYPELAIKEGQTLLEEAQRRFGLLDAACVHRLGRVEVGEPAVAITVASPHRREAFAACEFIIDELKKRVPIWKKEHFADGASGWVGLNPPPAADLYRRQTVLPEVGKEGQQRLADSRLLVVGAGGLGCPALLYLAAAGVGCLGICDGDTVEATNLHRQVLFGNPEIGRPKAATASATLSRMYPHLQIITHPERLSASNADSIISGYDLVLDCTDSFQAKFLLNDRCISLGRPLIQASIHQFEGQIQVIVPGLSSCLRCLFPLAPHEGCVGTCAESGVIGFTAGLFGTMQAAEAVKLLLGMGRPLTEETLLVDLRDWSMVRVQRERNPGCPACGSGTMERPLEIDWQTARTLENAQWIDVREPDEVADDPGPEEIAWLRLPLSRFSADIPVGVVVVACAHGVRSARVADQLRKTGRQAYSLAGGIAGLKSLQ
jgi:adenylyltransferase/sulfurtransferase